MNNGKAIAGWRTAMLCEAADVVMGSSPPGETYNEDRQGVPLINGPVEFGEGDFGLTIRGQYTTQPTKMCHTGDLLLCVRGSTTGRTNIAGFDACIGRGVAAIRAKENQQFLNHFIRTQRQRLFDLGNGSTFPSITQNQLAEVKVPLPPPPEQRRIAAILDKADAILRKREEGIRLTEELLRSTFRHQFGDPNTNPKGWSLERLGEHIAFMTSGSRGWAEYYAETGTRFIRSLDVQMNRIGDDEPAFVNPPQSSEAARTRVQEGDVLLTITGSKVGRVAFVPKGFGHAFVSQHVAILRLNGHMRPRFVSMFLTDEYGGQRQIKAAQYGQTKPGLNLDQIRRFLVPCPPLKDQDRFLGIWDRSDHMLGQKVKALEQARLLFGSLVQRAFRGEL